MSEIKFVHLYEVEEEKIIDLMNNGSVAKYLPLLSGEFSEEDCRTFLKAKKKLWKEHGFGPWAFLIDQEFAGWGGLQPEQGEADFALILHPKYWGWGLKIFREVEDRAFNDMNLSSITALLPPNRQNSKAITRFGFIEEGELKIDGKIFRKFRLNKPHS
jgi:RimJ/RimL family protein N-acetyltransferase